MVVIDNRYSNNIMDDIKENTDIMDIKYINKYDDNYIVLDKENLYLFNLDYEEVARLDASLIHKNSNNYDIVYRDKTIMYMDNYKNKEGIIFEYYDIYTYELIDSVVIGGK